MLILLVCSSFLCPQAVAFAQTSVQPTHAFVIGSDPVDGSTISAMPPVVRIYFNAPISSASFANVYTPHETLVDATHSIVVGGNARELDTPILHPQQLPQGSYTVRWTAIASTDGHTTNGVIGFNLGQSSSGLSGETILGPGTSNDLPTLNLIGVLAIAWEWLVLMALTFWVGTVVFAGLVMARIERFFALLASAQKRVLPLQWLCLTALLFGECIALILRAAQYATITSGGGIDLAAVGYLLTQTTYGYFWTARLLLILCSLGWLWWTTNRTHLSRPTTRATHGFRRMRQHATQDVSPTKEADAATDSTTNFTISRMHTLIWLVLIGLLLFTYALTSDVGQFNEPYMSTMVITWLYLIARCLWFGGLAYLAYVLLPLLPGFEPERNAETLIVLLQRFLPYILGAIGVFLVTDLYLTEANIRTFQLFLTDPYGRTVLVASGLLVVLLLLYSFALLWLQPKLIQQTTLLPVVDVELPARRSRQTALDATTRALRQLLIVHSWLAAVLLLCASLLSFFAPPIVFPNVSYTQNTSSTTSPSTPTTSMMQTQQVGTLIITLQVLPGRVAYPNTVIVSMNDSHGTPVTNARVQIEINMALMDMGIARATIAGGNPTYIAPFAKNATFSMAGRWNIALTIIQSGQPPLQTTFSINLANA